jgi:hypothetical protein
VGHLALPFDADPVLGEQAQVVGDQGAIGDGLRQSEHVRSGFAGIRLPVDEVADRQGAGHRHGDHRRRGEDLLGNAHVRVLMSLDRVSTR